ncbi:MAG TPA: helix-hairpin-helix domain-containing protein [Solirubrobacteraceae bacterium]|nr:helix-hairpin-helix domain-containing protein [Solirubrobacteraceae bacterium]
MSELDRPKLALYLALGVVVCFLGARHLAANLTPGAGARAGAGGATTAPVAAGERQPPVAPATVRVERAGGGRVTVHVAGAVRRPGVYRLVAGARVDDALRHAGGARPRADLDALNLAAKVEDGRQVLVPVRGARATAASPPAGAAAAASGSGSAAAAAQPVNLNTATLEQLDALDGIGPGIAQRILDYREQHGGFRRVEELAEVPGIGPKRLAALTPLVTV